MTICTAVVIFFCFKNSADSQLTYQGQKPESSFYGFSFSFPKSSSFHQRASDSDIHSLGLETIICSIKIQYFNSIYTLQISHLPSKKMYTSFRKKKNYNDKVLKKSSRNPSPPKRDNGAHHW